MARLRRDQRPALRSLRRRYHALLALRFVPTGLLITVFVLLLRDRGLTLAEIGLGTAAQGGVMLFLELPSGGLADAVGRKPVLLAAGVVSVAAMGVLLVADSVALVALVAALQGVFRALDSGPLQAWFVDSALALTPELELERDLARADVVICSAIGAGALVGGVIVRLGGLGSVAPLVAPVVVALVVQVVGVAAVATLMHEDRPHRGWVAVRRSVGDVPEVVTAAVRAIRAAPLLQALVAGELLWGFGMIAFETLLPPRMAEVTGGARDAAALLGPSLTAAWVLSALGAAASPWLVRRWGPGPTACGLRLLHGVTVMGMGLAAGPVGLVAAYLATYWVHGATAPVHYGMVHRGVDAAHRATVVSANSLASQVGGAVSGVALGALADATSIASAMLVAAAVLAAAGPLYLVGRSAAAPRLEEPIPRNL